MSEKPNLSFDQSIRLSIRLSMQLVREQVTPILVLFGIGALISIVLEDTLQSLSNTEETQRLILQLAMGIWEMIEGLALLLSLSWGIPKVRELNQAHFVKQPFHESYLNSFLAEYLRLLANVLMWGTLLIVPGFLRYCRLIFVPYVALFARPYREGKVDALELAAKLSQGRLALIVILILATTAVQLGFEFLPQMYPDLHILPLRILFAGLSYLISIWLYAIFYLHFEQAMEGHKWT